LGASSPAKAPTFVIKYARDGKETLAYPVPTKLSTKWYERKSLRKILILPAQPAIVAEVATNSPAAVAGLAPDDEIVALNGEKILLSRICDLR